MVTWIDEDDNDGFCFLKFFINEVFLEILFNIC